MASVLQNVKATMAWQKHQLLADFDENESPVPDKFKRKAALSSLNTICMSLRKRAPLKRVELNFHNTPARESLEARQRCQTLQTIKRTAKNAFGTVSQKIQKSCQSPVQPMVTFPAESISRSCVTSSTKKKSTTPQTPCYKTVTPAASTKGIPRSSKRTLLGSARVSEHGEWRDCSSWLGKNAVSLRRSRRAAALKSPYSSPAPTRKIECNCKLGLVSSGICQLKRISQAFDDAIVKEESRSLCSCTTSPLNCGFVNPCGFTMNHKLGFYANNSFSHPRPEHYWKQATSNYYCLMAENLPSACQSVKPSQAIRREAKKLHQALGT